MRMLYCKLIGYAGVYNGLGLDEIEIDFSNAKHRICLIVGPNGVGKSTIASAISSILPDDNGYFICNRDGQKIQTVDVDGIIYGINIISKVAANGKRTNSAYITKNGEELNPNGNITSYKDIVFSEFDIDANYIAMSKISGDDRGIVDNTPSERKRLVSTRIACLEVYNDIYKNLNKKANIFKSHLNSIASKLQNLGDRSNLEARMIDISKSEYALTTAIEDNKSKLVEAQTTIKMMDPTGEDSKYKGLTEKSQTLRDSKERIEKKIDIELHDINTRVLSEDLNDILKDPDKYIAHCRVMHGEAEKTISSLTGYNNATTEKINNINITLTGVMSTITQINSDDRFSNYQTVVAAKAAKESELETLRYDNFNTKLASLVSDGFIDSTMASNILEFLKSMNQYIYEYANLPEFTDNISKMVMEIWNSAPYTDWKASTDICKKKIKEATEELETDEDIISNNEKKLIKLQTQKEELESYLYGFSVPEGCKLGDICSFAREYNYSKTRYKELGQEIALLKVDLEDYKRRYEETKERLDDLKSALDFLSLFSNIITLCKYNVEVLKKLYGIDFDITTITPYHFKNDLPKQQIDTNPYYDLHNYSIEYTRLSTAIKVLDDKIAEYNDISLRHDQLVQEKEDLQKEYDSLRKIIADNKLEIEEYERGKEKYRHNLNLLEQIKVDKADLKAIEEEYNSVETEIASIRKNGEKVIELSEQLEKYQDIINEGMSRLAEVSKEKKQLESQLTMWDNFKEEYDLYNEKYNYINILRKYSSPTQGSIQSLYMSMYMNKTIDLSNQLLGMLFGGQYRLLEYIINEDEFRIPFVGNGMVVDDISSGSTSQKCIFGTVINLVLRKSTSNIYDIALLDEVDGGLDTSNRTLFPSIADKLCDILKISQLFSISHSLEASMINLDVILLSRDKSYKDQFANANIIYQLD